MNREELINSKEYWTTKIQLDLFKAISHYMKKNNLNRTQLAEKLNVTKGYVSQVLNGDFDHKVSKLVELSLACGLTPRIQFEKIEDYVKNDGFVMEKETKFSEVETLVIPLYPQSDKKTTIIKESVAKSEHKQKYTHYSTYLISGTNNKNKTAICN